MRALLVRESETMSYEIKEFAVAATDNIHTLVGKLYIPEGEIKGLFHIVHGMCEYIDRYDSFMSYLAENGYLAFGYDNLGHGKTAKDDSELGFIAHRDGWKHLVNDVAAYESAVKTLYPDIPLYLFGHSMGSFIARLAAETQSDNIERLIICGTAGKNPLAPLGLIITRGMRLLFGEKHISRLVLSIAFGAYNMKFERLSDYEWLTTDREIIEKYQNDKYCTFSFTVSAMHDLIKLISLCNRSKWFKNINKELPIMLISGSDDPVGNYGKGVIKVHKKLKCSEKNADLKLYKNCRHEILNDSCRQEAYDDILKFIEL